MTNRPKTEWFARVSFLDGHRWHNYTLEKFQASTPWTAAKLAIQGAKLKLPKRTRVEEVTCHLHRIKAVANGQEA